MEFGFQGLNIFSGWGLCLPFHEEAFCYSGAPALPAFRAHPPPAARGTLPREILFFQGETTRSRRVHTVYLEPWLCLAEEGNKVTAFSRYFQALLFANRLGLYWRNVAWQPLQLYPNCTWTGQDSGWKSVHDLISSIHTAACRTNLTSVKHFSMSETLKCF